MNLISDQSLLAQISQFELLDGEDNKDLVSKLKNEFLKRREEEHMGVSEISVLNYCGRAINPFALFDSDFDNIGEQLSVTLPRICRFWGQTKIFYSVAQHCLSMVEYFNTQAVILYPIS